MLALDLKDLLQWNYSKSVPATYSQFECTAPKRNRLYISSSYLNCGKRTRVYRKSSPCMCTFVQGPLTSASLSTGRGGNEK